MAPPRASRTTRLASPRNRAGNRGREGGATLVSYQETPDFTNVQDFSPDAGQTIIATTVHAALAKMPAARTD